MDKAEHLCDHRCICPACGAALYYAPFWKQHACSRAACAWTGPIGRTLQAIVAIVAIVATTACGSSSTAPSPAPTPTPTPSTVTLSGRVTATNGGQALSGLSARIGATAVTTDSAGAFVAQAAPVAAMQLALTGSSIVPRTLTFAAATTREVAVNAIALGGNFDLTFYRQLVRNGFEGGSEPLRRWTVAPSIYLRTVRDDGVTVDAAMLDTVENVIRDAMPRWSGLNPAIVTRGTDTRVGQAGWVTVAWPGLVGANRQCGNADVALSGGVLNLFVPTPAACGCDGSTRIRPRVIRHELGHVMGFWHTDSPTDVMIASSGLCDIPISARELAHAAIAYARPVGNVDPDTDPSSMVNLAPMRVH